MKITTDEAKKRLNLIVKHSENDMYDYEVRMNVWENYGKSRTYLKIVEIGKNSKHYVERKYGYIDNQTGEYHPEKNDLTENYTFGGGIFEEVEEAEEVEAVEAEQVESADWEETHTYHRGVEKEHVTTTANGNEYTVEFDYISESDGEPKRVNETARVKLPNLTGNGDTQKAAIIRNETVQEMACFVKEFGIDKVKAQMKASTVQEIIDYMLNNPSKFSWLLTETDSEKIIYVRHMYGGSWGTYYSREK